MNLSCEIDKTIFRKSQKEMKKVESKRGCKEDQEEEKQRRRRMKKQRREKADKNGRKLDD